MKDTGMYQNLVYHETPVDRMAASMFYKTPWWAEVPEPVKKAVIESVLPEETISVDYFRPPPPAPIRTIAPTDRRGTRVWLYADCGVGMVTGYSFVRKRGAIISKSSAMHSKPKDWVGHWDCRSRIGKKIKENEHCWWLLINGKFQVIGSKDIRRYSKKRENLKTMKELGV